MATLSIQIVSGLGTSTKTLTFVAADASRILTAYQNRVNPGGTQDQLAAYIAVAAKRFIAQLVTDNETVPPAPPVMT